MFVWHICVVRAALDVGPWPLWSGRVAVLRVGRGLVHCDMLFVVGQYRPTPWAQCVRIDVVNLVFICHGVAVNAGTLRRKFFPGWAGCCSG